MISKLQSEREFDFTHFAYPSLLTMTSKLSEIYKFYMNYYNRPCHISSETSEIESSQEMRMENSYPPVLLKQWSQITLPEFKNIYAQSMCVLKMLTILLKKCIKSLIDPFKIGYYGVLIRRILHSLDKNYELTDIGLDLLIFKPALKLLFQVPKYIYIYIYIILRASKRINQRFTPMHTIEDLFI